MNAHGFARAALTLVPLFLAACASNPVEAPAPAPAPAKVAPTPVAAPPAPTTMPVAPASVVPDYLDPSRPVYMHRSVYFAFDEAVIRDADRPVIDTQGQYLSRHADVHVRVEGNTDERGGSEYNLALGQRRAEAVVKALKIFGVKDSQLEAVSYGKERPKAAGHDEQAWAQNRRADVVYPSK